MSEEICNAVVPVALLDGHARNYRAHPPGQIRQLVASLERFQQVRSIVVQRRSERYTILAGHGLVEAARECQMETLRCDIVPESWDVLTCEAYLIADNRLSDLATDDETILAELLQAQHDAGFDLTALGSDEETLRQMLEAMGDAYLSGDDGDGDGGDDYEVDTDEIEIRCKVGEIYQLGRHRRACGDLTDRDLVNRLMQDERAICCWTDPPYGVSYVGKTKNALKIENDGKEDIDAFLQRAFAAIDSVLDAGAAIYITHPPGALCMTFGNRFVAQGWRFHQTLIWVKDSMVLGHSDYHFRHEPIYFGYKPGQGRFGRGGKGWYGDDSQKSVFEIPRPKRSEEHPTMKPVELIEAMLVNSSPMDGLVYDPFLGSGSTLIAGERLQRRVYGCELDVRYATVILNRWEAETGKEAELVERVEALHA